MLKDRRPWYHDRPCSCCSASPNVRKYKRCTRCIQFELTGLLAQAYCDYLLACCLDIHPLDGLIVGKDVVPELVRGYSNAPKFYRAVAILDRSIDRLGTGGSIVADALKYRVAATTLWMSTSKIALVLYEVLFGCPA